MNLQQKQATFKILFTLGMGSSLQDVGAELASLPEGFREELTRLMGNRVQ